MKADNENEKFSFITLAAATANVVRYLSSNEKKDEDAHNKRDPSEAHKDCVPEKLEDIERRIADILAMERRLQRKRI
jgi:hypothetical protein